MVGLNPHAGEGGLLGVEDRDVIAPALAAPTAGAGSPARSCPTSRSATRVAAASTTRSSRCITTRALIPVKLVDFDEAVNVTLGLPIVRTSPDHGTAYDIAGRGLARATSMQRALALAIEMVRRRLTHRETL